MRILPGELKEFAVSLTDERASDITAIIQHCEENYNILSKKAFCAFISNVVHESAVFRIKKESLNYTTPERLVAVWPSRFNLTGTGGKKNAHEYTRQPEKLANLVYGGRMGNTEPGDGALFVGGGFAQITGRDAYSGYTSSLDTHGRGKWSLMEVAGMVQTNDTWAMDSAYWFFCDFKNMEQLAESGDIKGVRKVWNGGTIGLAEVTTLYEKALKTFV